MRRSEHAIFHPFFVLFKLCILGALLVFMTMMAFPPSTATRAAKPVQVYPEHHAVGVAMTSVIEVVFPKPIFTDTITANTFSIHGSRSGKISGTYAFSVDRRTVTFTPATSYYPGEVVRPVLSPFIIEDPYARIEPFQWAFRVRVSSDKQCFQGFTLKEGVDYSSLTGISLDWADFDANGMLDLAFSGTRVQDEDNVPYAKIYHDAAPGPGVGNTLSIEDVTCSALDWGDYDNDGDMDLLLTGSTNIFCSSMVTHIYRNDGVSPSSGTHLFYDIGASITQVANGSAVWGDHDNDGDLDFVISGWRDLSDPVLEVYTNWDGDFSLHASLPGIRKGKAVWGDYDNDGDLDLLAAGDNGVVNAPVDMTRIYRNDGMGGFNDINADLIQLWSADVDWGDYNQDGWLDFVVVGSNWDTQTRHAIIYRNNGDGTFSDIDAGLEAVDGEVEWGDFDGDGDLDIVLSGQGNSGHLLHVYRNDGTGDARLFVDIEADLLTLLGRDVQWIDDDADGDLDIHYSGFYGGQPAMGVYLNNTEACSDDATVYLPLVVR